jgi:riboflavin synthase
MFTGLIREVAKVGSFQNSRLTVISEYTPKIGDSVAVNGACLTVVEVDTRGFSVELSEETTSHISTDNLSGSVHIEPAMQMGDRFEGHIVQGHIDYIGTVSKIEKAGNSYDIYIDLPKESLSLMIPKGSITVDGVSLTINSVTDSGVRLTIIPHTMENTIFKNYRVGTRVNVESDMFARYIENILLKRGNRQREALSWSEVDSIMMRY